MKSKNPPPAPIEEAAAKYLQAVEEHAGTLYAFGKATVELDPGARFIFHGLTRFWRPYDEWQEHLEAVRGHLSHEMGGEGTMSMSDFLGTMEVATAYSHTAREVYSQLFERLTERYGARLNTATDPDPAKRRESYAAITEEFLHLLLMEQQVRNQDGLLLDALEDLRAAFHIQPSDSEQWQEEIKARQRAEWEAMKLREVKHKVSKKIANLPVSEIARIINRTQQQTSNRIRRMIRDGWLEEPLTRGKQWWSPEAVVLIQADPKGRAPKDFSALL